jgi:hypothetical protein
MKYKFSDLLLLLCGTLFITLYFILSFNNRLPYEDYIFTSLTKDKGPIDAMLYIYKVYSARWSAHTLAFYFSQFYPFRYFLFCFNILTLTALILSFYLLLKRILREILDFNIQNRSLMLYTLLFTCGFFFSSYDIGQTWFWYMVNWMYLWSIIAGNYLCWILMNGKFKKIHFPFIIILTAYIAGAAESYSMIFIFFLALILILKNKNKIPVSTNRIQNKAILLALCSLIAFYMITVFAPGTWARKSILTQTGCLQHIIMLFKGFGIVIIRYSPKIIPSLLLFGFPWMLLGQSFSSGENTKAANAFRMFIKSASWTGILIFLLIVPASWILYDPPPARALSQVSFLLSVYAALSFFYAGYKIEIHKRYVQTVSFTSLIISVCLISFHIFSQYRITSRYAAAYDAGISKVLKENEAGRTTYLQVDPLPESGMIYSDGLSPDTTGNQYYENVYGLTFHVSRK